MSFLQKVAALLTGLDVSVNVPLPEEFAQMSALMSSPEQAEALVSPTGVIIEKQRSEEESSFERRSAVRREVRSSAKPLYKCFNGTDGEEAARAAPLKLCLTEVLSTTCTCDPCRCRRLVRQQKCPEIVQQR